MSKVVQTTYKSLNFIPKKRVIKKTMAKYPKYMISKAYRNHNRNIPLFTSRKYHTNNTPLTGIFLHNPSNYDIGKMNNTNITWHTYRGNVMPTSDYIKRIEKDNKRNDIVIKRLTEKVNTCNELLIKYKNTFGII